MISSRPAKGTRDFGPHECRKREYLFNIIKTEFEKIGLGPLETSAIENIEVLTGKYGDEGDKLIFKILNSGDYLKKIPSEQMAQISSTALSKKICEKGLRYDLTVPMARYISGNKEKLNFPFKRYQIQNVWRAERPQKGRYREFYQCDADIIGDNSLFNETELLSVYNKVFDQLKIDDYTILINSRKILAGIAEVIGAQDFFIPMTMSIDKLDKIGSNKVIQELKDKGLPQNSLNKLIPLLEKNFSLLEMQEFLQQSEVGTIGVNEITEVFATAKIFKISNLEFSSQLARGLDYYTGAIFEVQCKNTSIGSIASGGRYDNLTELFGVKGLSGVGISFGADRIYDVLEERNLFPAGLQQNVDVLIINFDDLFKQQRIELYLKLKNFNIKTQYYPSAQKLKKQMKYANENSIPFVIIMGEDEMQKKQMLFKDMQLGEQSVGPLDETISLLIKKIKP